MRRFMSVEYTTYGRTLKWGADIRFLVSNVLVFFVYSVLKISLIFISISYIHSSVYNWKEEQTSNVVFGLQLI
jgi:hypothetical protein